MAPSKTLLRQVSNPGPSRLRRPNYQYEPLLSAQHIRLLTIQSYDAVQGQVLVTIDQHVLKDVAGKFTALSYTWGPSVQDFDANNFKPKSPPGSGGGGSSAQAASATVPSSLAAASQPSNPPPSQTKPSPLARRTCHRRRHVHNVELLILPPSAFTLFERHDDLALDGDMVDMCTAPVTRLRLAENLSDWFRSYLTADNAVLVSRNTAARIFWIDAVCIDQANSVEKASQIALMGRIYSLAARVLAWLGDVDVGEDEDEDWEALSEDERREKAMRNHDPDKDLAVFRWLHDVVFTAMDAFQRAGGPLAIQHLRNAEPTSSAFWRDTFGLVPFPGRQTWARCWMAYGTFYHARHYFRRVWIVQEVALAGKLELQCGPHRLNWDRLVAFAVLLSSCGWMDVLAKVKLSVYGPSGDLTRIVTQDHGFGIIDIAWLQNLQQEIRRVGTTTSFVPGSTSWARHWWYAILTVRRRQCSVAQDKVYATLGLLELALPPGTDIPIMADNKSSPDEVYTNAAAVFVRSLSDLTVLSYVEPPSLRVRESLPSWVPDLTVPPSAWPLGGLGTHFTAGILSSPSDANPGGRHNDFLAPAGAVSTQTPASLTAEAPPPKISAPPFSVMKNELRVRGFRVSASGKRYVHPRNFTRTVDLAVDLLQVLADLPARYPHVSPPSIVVDNNADITSGQLLSAALLHTMTCQEFSNMNRGTVTETARLARSFHSWLVTELGRLWLGARLQPGDAEYTEGVVERCRLMQGRVTKLLSEIALSSAHDSHDRHPHDNDDLGKSGVDGNFLVPTVDELAAHGEAMYKAEQEKQRGETASWPPCMALAQDFSNQIQKVFAYRSLFWSATDGWLGLWPEDCGERDEVWILEHGRVPFVLRRREEQPSTSRPTGNRQPEVYYEFRGECYLHGAMHGQLMSKAGEQMQDIVIT